MRNVSFSSNKHIFNAIFKKIRNFVSFLSSISLIKRNINFYTHITQFMSKEKSGEKEMYTNLSPHN